MPPNRMANSSPSDRRVASVTGGQPRALGSRGRLSKEASGIGVAFLFNVRAGGGGAPQEGVKGAGAHRCLDSIQDGRK